jgi:hypothetical protein
MQALVDTVPPEDAGLSPPAGGRLVSPEVQWDLLSQGTGTIEAGTRAKRIAEWLRRVQDGETADLEAKTVISNGKVHSAFVGRSEQSIEVWTAAPTAVQPMVPRAPKPRPERRGRLAHRHYTSFH